MQDYGSNFRAQKVDAHQFAMVPHSDIPRSSFRMQSQHKTTFGANALIPVFLQEILPGDSFNLSMTCFSRMSTPIVPILDNLDLESWFFFVPNRLVWFHWVNFMGEQPQSPEDGIDFTIPQCVSPAGGFAYLSLFDYFGIPGQGQIIEERTTSVSALPLRAYNMIYNQWFRDQNLNNAVGYGASNSVYDLYDGPDPYTNYGVQAVNKRHDYFTSCLPWTEKGGVAVQLPLSGQATVMTSATELLTGTANGMTWREANGTQPGSAPLGFSAGSIAVSGTSAWTPSAFGVYPTNLYADLSTATAATINSIRLAFQTQKLLERDARGGTRYTEIIRSHFGVMSPDMRLQRPEYLGGGKTPVNITPVPQTSGTGASGTTTPAGSLSAVGTAVARNHGFRQSFTEHGYVIGLVAVRRDQAYQNGLRRLWTRSTRYDFYFPVFSMLGEQAVRMDEIYLAGTSADSTPFGYQERWAEYRYFPSMITGEFRSTYSAPLDYWHLCAQYGSAPSLNATWIADDTSVVLDRALAAGESGNSAQFLCDFFFDIKAARPMPMYSVPGLIDHF